jgi:hypothetical protein
MLTQAQRAHTRLLCHVQLALHAATLVSHHSEAHTYSKFKALQRERGLYTSPSLMAGRCVYPVLATTPRVQAWWFSRCTHMPCPCIASMCARSAQMPTTCLAYFCKVA